ncbi:hypothetical protein WG31_11315 [Acetobacter oryzifermentans]|uniref:Uncharacterized protein n=1 Tax=Acetobacter oryzifermentans TaxID=1633874 RepID=A0ABM6AL30_9PROT|nr:hypothetical protein WG31_11315 [Acetobacter oryzifermentans]
MLLPVLPLPVHPARYDVPDGGRSPGLGIWYVRPFTFPAVFIGQWLAVTGSRSNLPLQLREQLPTIKILLQFKAEIRTRHSLSSRLRSTIHLFEYIF